MENRLHFVNCDRMPRSKAERVLTEAAASLKAADPFYHHIVVGYSERYPLEETVQRCRTMLPPVHPDDFLDWCATVFA